LSDNVDAIRWHIEEVDNQIMELIGQRMHLAKQMGQHKMGKGMPVRHLRVEDEVLARYAARAQRSDITEDAARRIAHILIHESVDAQFRLPRPEGKMITVVGATGKMGGWLVRYLGAQGHDVTVSEIVSRSPYEYELARSVGKADIVIISTPISATGELLDKVLSLEPKGTVFDIASIKTPLVPRLRQAAESGLKVCSVHPMFGPDVESLLDRNVLVCDCGSEEGLAVAHDMFQGTGANVHEIHVEEHDKLMSYVLGMSHALNIAFFNALVNSGLTKGELDQAASTTFRHQECASRRVAEENPELYYEIQHLNPHTKEALDLLVRSIEEIREAATADRSDEFVRIMEQGRRYLGGRS
jgi:chorismate mutase/prephenate dehydrogenase